MIITTIKDIGKQKVKGSIVISILLSLCYMYGDIKVLDNAFSLLTILKALLAFIIYYFLIKTLKYLTTIKNIKIECVDKLDYSKIWHIFIFLLIVWLPHLLVKYPIAFWYDEYREVEQGLCLSSLNGHFPIFYTYLLTGFYRLGELLGNHNIGMFLFSLINYLITALIYSYVISKLAKHGISNLLLTIFVLFFGFCPYVAGYIGCSVKDAYYSSYVVLLCLLLLDYITNRDLFWENKKELFLIFISCILISLIRKNGLYVVIISIIVIIVLEIQKRNKKNVIVLVLVLLTSFGLCKYFESIPKIKGEITEALSIPFQQTARLVTYRSDLITEEEKAIIDKILPYDDLPTLYDEDISDPVKFAHRKFTNEDLIEYFKVWFKQFFRAPLLYFEATFRQNIYLVFPGENIYKYNVECNGGVLNGRDQSEGLVQTPLWLKNNIQGYYWSALNITHELPVIRFINNMATFIILFIFSLMIILNEKAYKKLIPLVPVIVSLLIVIASPTIRTHPRYTFPIIYTLPIWISLLRMRINENNF